MRMLAAGCLLIVAVVIGAYEVSVAAYYQWEDSNGVLHFTDNPEKIPSVYRKKVRELDLKNDGPAPASVVEKAAPSEQTPGTGDAQPNEQLWRSRYAELHSEIKLLKDRLPVMREELTEVNRRRAKFQKGSDRIAFNELSAEITRSEERIKELEKQLYDLDLEAARNAVPLEWRK